ncbi:MAG: hypothetical protein NDI77_02775 [Geobacteraceae bacterium]|nr:hypothetical protein [Geobacteraceae bacterium]
MNGAEFVEEVEKVVKIYEREIGHHASRTRPMIDRLGEIEALSRLMISGDLQHGFRVLRDRGLLDKTFEALVVRHRHLFKTEVVQAAQWRLDHPNDLL